jgi:transcriptional regulator with GAF, ATPase, and Fis domain
VIKTVGPVLSRQTIMHMKRDGGATTLRIPTKAESGPVKTLADAERAHITAMLRETNGIVGGPRGAAAQLGLARTTLIARMQRLGISHKASGPRTHFRTMDAAAAGSWRVN